MIKNENRFNVIVADPPWRYDNKRTGGTHKSGSGQKYQTLSTVDIQSLYAHTELSNLIADNAVLFLWTTNSMLPYAMVIPELWDFEYKTMITWLKKSYGLGYWFRSKTEHLLLGVRNRGGGGLLGTNRIAAFRSNLPNVIKSDAVLKHSQKPMESYELIEKATENIAYPRYLELFATRQYKDWTCLGYNLSGKDIETELKELADKQKCI